MIGQKETATTSRMGGPFYISQPSPSPAVKQRQNTSVEASRQAPPSIFPKISRGVGQSPAGRAATPLDTLASKVSLTDWKDRRHKLRHTSGEVIGGRTAKCGHTPIGGSLITVHRGDNGKHHFNGLETCGSVWTCPVCAVKITEQRRTDVKQVLETHLLEGGKAAMFTMTVPHTRFHRASETRKAVAEGWKNVQQGIGWKTMKSKSGFIGSIRALEVTYGNNGWHPHLHVVILFNQGLTEGLLESYSGNLFDRWSRSIERLGFGTCSEKGFSCEPITDAEGVSKYCQKWGAAEELTKAHIKSAKNGGRSPWQILSDIEESNKPQDRALFSEYASAFKGARQLTWSRGLRELYIEEEDQPDEDIAEAPESDDVETSRALIIDRNVWKKIAGRVLQGKLLTAMDTEGAEGVYKLLKAYRIPYAIGERQGRYGNLVPFILDTDI